MSECHVYLIVSDATAPNGPIIRMASHRWRLCKVGISRSPSSRLAALQTASPHKLWTYGTWDFPSRTQAERVERKAHGQLRGHHTSGEWFFSEPEFVEEVILGSIATVAADEWKWPIEKSEGLLRLNGCAKDAVKYWLDYAYGRGEFA